MDDKIVEQYASLIKEQSNLRNTIDGELNRLAVTRDNDERIELCRFLQLNILKYLAVSMSIIELCNIYNESKFKEQK